MTIFAEKLATLTATVRMGADGPIDAVASALRDGAGRPAVAIGSGGSAIMAEFFARCRSTLGLGPTIVQTPMEFVLAQDGWTDFDTWLFSAGADNPDVAGALTTALGSGAANIRLLTVNAHGATAIAAAKHDRVQVMVAPVADRKDGFLATHSLVAMVTCMLAASDTVAKLSAGTEAVERYAQEIERVTCATGPGADAFRDGDTVVLLHDPQCRTLATLIETSLWETGIAPVQRSDFRNFAHGRHVWAARHPDTMFVLAVTSAASREIWDGIRSALPEKVRIAEVDLGQAGRFRTAVSVVEGLMTILLMGDTTSTDPGRPGHGEFAGAIYGDPGLAELADRLDPAVRHKLRAVQRQDDPACPSTAAHLARSEWLGAISGACIGAIVLDYDGTVVTTEARLDPPTASLVDELTRLADSGIGIAFATGRGGSAGEALRAALPERLHPVVTVGYYNGGYIRPLSVDIESDPPTANPDLVALADWIEGQGLLKPGVSLKRGRIQITINHADVLALSGFAAAISSFPAIASGSIKIMSSHHSFDLLPSGTSKTSVSMRMRASIAEGAKVLAIGDSGEPGGNDIELLADPPSVSVDGVCGHLSGSWSLFGQSPSGPAALLRILRALRVENGHARLDLDSLDACPV
jgi:fructoselysine-6-P-deglycase FrlB-like protein